jgi:hypothetical protein
MTVRRVSEGSVFCNMANIHECGPYSSNFGKPTTGAQRQDLRKCEDEAHAANARRQLHGALWQLASHTFLQLATADVVTLVGVVKSRVVFMVQVAPA